MSFCRDALYKYLKRKFCLEEIKISENILPGIEKLEAHPLLEMAKETPIFVVNNRVYAANNAANEKELTEIGTLDSLDELMLERNSEAIKLIKASYAKETWENLNFENKIGKMNLDLAQLIITQVFPHFRTKKYEDKIASMVDETNISEDDDKKDNPAPELEKEKREIIEKQLERIVNETRVEIGVLRKEIQAQPLIEVDEEDDEDKEETAEEPVYREGMTFEEKLDMLLYEKPKPKINTSRLDELLEIDETLESNELGKKLKKPEPIQEPEIYNGNSLMGLAAGYGNFALINKEIFSLASKNKKLKKHLVIDGKTYLPREKLDEEKFKKRYESIISKRIQLQTLDESFSEEKIRDITRERFSIANGLLGLKEYEEGEVGFLQKEGVYYVYIKVPAFAVKNPVNGKYYRLNATRVGFDITKEYGALYLRDTYPVIIEDNLHPWAHQRGNFAGICMGANNINLGRLNGEQIATSLKKLRDVMFYAAANDSSRFFYYFPTENNSNFNIKSMVRSKEDLIKEGVTIFE